MKDKQLIAKLVLDVAREFNRFEAAEQKIELDHGDHAPLYHAEGALDSLGLVVFVTAVEQAIAERLSVSVSLADEKAFALRHSPFRTVGTMVDYICTQIQLCRQNAPVEQQCSVGR